VGQWGHTGAAGEGDSEWVGDSANAAPTVPIELRALQQWQKMRVPVKIIAYNRTRDPRTPEYDLCWQEVDAPWRNAYPSLGGARPWKVSRPTSYG
jgi:hypothetical protein